MTQTAGTYAVDGVPPVLYTRHGGLLDVAVGPNFEENGLIYLSDLQGEETASTVKVMRARFDSDQEALTDQQVIFEGSPGATPELLGGRIALYRRRISFSLSWRSLGRCQSTGPVRYGGNHRAHKERRIDPRGQPVPHHGGGRAQRSGATDIALRRGLPSTRPRASSGPLPSATEIWIGALAGEMVVQLTLNDNCVLTEEHLFHNQLGRVRDVRVDDSGVLYILTDGEEGKLCRVERPHVSEDDKTHL